MDHGALLMAEPLAEADEGEDTGHNEREPQELHERATLRA